MRRSAFFLALFIPLSPRAATSPIDLLQEGLEAVLDDRYEDAARAFQSVLQQDPGNSAAQRGLKNAQQKIQEKRLQRREEEKPVLEGARKAMAREDWPEAVDRLEGVLSRQPDHPEALSLRMKVRARMSKQMEKSKPQSGDWYYAQGVLAYMDKDWLKAVDCWDQVMAFNPDKVSLLGKIDRAKDNLRAEERQGQIRLNQMVAFESLKKGDYGDAIHRWQDVLALDPENVQAKEGVAQAQKAWDDQRQRERQEEIQKLSEMGMDAYIEKDHKRSRAMWNKVLELDPANTLARDYLQRMGGRASGRVEGAAAPQAAYQKAMGFLAEGRTSEGIEALERYVAKFPGDKRAQDGLKDARAKQKELADKAYQDGLMSYSQGDIAGAIAGWQSVLRTDPDYQKARQAIIKAMAEQKKRGK